MSVYPFPPFVLLVLVMSSAASRAGAPAAAVADSPAPNWLVQVEHVARQDPRLQDVQRIMALEQKIDRLSGEDGAARHALVDELARERVASDERRGFIVYGRRASADAKGRPVESGRGLAAFLLPADRGTRRTLEGIKPGGFVLVQATGSRPLLTIAGRAWVEARRAQASTLEPDWGAVQAWSGPPVPTDAAPGNVTAALRFQHVKERDAGEGYRYSLSFTADAPPPGTNTARVWYESRYRTTRNEIIGPVLDDVVLERGNNGQLVASFAFDVVAPRTTTLDPTAATVDVVSVVWQ